MRWTAQAGLLATLLGFASACTYSKATYHLADAELTIIRAKQYGAAEHSVYEMTMAQRYLDKAREEAGYSEFKTSWDLAIIAAEWADQAVISMEERGIRAEASPQVSDMKGPAAASAPAPKPASGGYNVPKPGGAK